MKKIFLLMILLVSSHSYADDDCTIAGNPASSWSVPTLSFSLNTPLSVGRDTPPGTVLIKQLASGGDISNIFCSPNNAATIQNIPNKYPIKSGVTGVYKTNVPGIGIMGKFRMVRNDFKWWEDQDHTEAFYTYGMHGWFALVTTDEPLTGGTIQTGTLDNVRIMNPGSKNVYPLYNISLTTPIVVNIRACSITTPTVNVPLGDVLKSNFTNVGKTLVTKNFTVSLNCGSDTPIKYTLDGTKNANTELNSVLALTDAGNPDVATGVGVQILSDATPIDLGVFKSTVSDSGAFNISFSARYYQTLPTVTTGQANTTATLNLTYQ